jgi:hypothetical protein
VSDRPERVERRGRATSTSQPPSRPEPGPGRPVRSNGPERSPLTGPGPRVRRPGPEGPALRVVLVSRDKMLAGALRSLIDAPGGVRLLDWNSDELDSAIRHADVVIVDMPPTLHQRTFDVIDGRFLGRTVVLLQEGERAEAVLAGSSRSILYRPVQIGELWSAVTGVKGGPVTGERAASGVEQGDGEMENQVGEPETEAAEALEAGGSAPGEPEAPPGAEIEPEPSPEPEFVPEPDPSPEPVFQPEPDPSSDPIPQPDPSSEPEVQPGPEAAASDQPPVDAAAGVEAEAQGLPVAESGRLIGLSGQELDPVVGPGQVAPGMDEATFERLRGWRTGPGARQPAGTRKGPAPGRRRSEPESGAARRVREADAEARREQARREKEARARDQKAARAEAGRQRAARADARTAAREESPQAKAAKAEARQEAARQRAVQAEERRAANAEARRMRVAGAEAAGAAAVGAPTHLADRLALPALVVVLLAVLATGAAGWVGNGGADTRAGEVAVARAVGSGGGLVVQDPRVGPIEPLHALGVGVWLRVTEAGGSLEAVIREARVPSRFLLAGVAGLTAVLFLLLIRVGPGSGAAAGPGPAPPQRPERRWRLGGAALAGALVALDPLLVRSGRSATGTVLAVLLAVGTVALAWGVPARPALRWLPLVAACGGLALLVSPLALAVVAVPVVAELLQGRYQEASKDMAALGLAIGLWLLLPMWVAGQDLGAGQAGWLLGRPSGRGPVAESVTAAPLTWLLVAAGLAAAGLTWRHRSGARSDGGPEAARLLAWTATSAAGALGAIALGYPAEQSLPFAVPAAAVSLAVGAVTLAAAGGTRQARRVALAGAGVMLVGLLAAQAVDWAGRYGKPADDGLGRLVATVGTEVPSCSAVNADGPDDRARLLAAGVTVTDFSDGPAALAAGVRYFVLTGGTRHPVAPSLSAWVRQHGTMLAAHSSRSLHGVELWRVDAAPLDPKADLLPLPDGVFSNTTGSACGGYRVVDSQVGTFHTAYRSVGGKAVLGRPLGSVWTSDGPALQAFDTMVLGAVPTAGGPPAVRPVELPPLLAKLDVEAVADADIPLPSVRPPVTNREVRALLREELIGRAYLGTDPATATNEDFRRARDRFGRPLGLPQMMPDGAMRQPFERAVLELPADGGPVRPAALGRLAVQLGLVPRQAMRPEPVPGLPAREAETRLDPAPLLRLVGGALGLLLLAAGAGAVVARRSGAGRGG